MPKHSVSSLFRNSRLSKQYSARCLNFQRGSFGILKAQLGSPFACYRGHLGPKVEKKSENESPGPLGPGGPKSPNQSRKRVKIVKKESILTRFRLRFGLCGPPGPRGPGDSFSDFFSTLGPKGPNDPCSRQTGSQGSTTKT